MIARRVIIRHRKRASAPQIPMKTRPSHSSRRLVKRARRGSIANAALIAVLFLCGIAIALSFERRSSDEANSGLIDPVARPAEDALGVSKVKTINDSVVPLLTKGEPAIIMISSEVCEWCKKTLLDLRELSAGRPLPRLKLLTLEGAALGTDMVTKAGLKGLQLIGPVDGRTRVSLTFRFQGTPTFFAVDRNGNVAAMLPGYPARDVLTRWYNVMVGDADVP